MHTQRPPTRDRYLHYTAIPGLERGRRAITRRALSTREGFYRELRQQIPASFRYVGFVKIERDLVLAGVILEKCKEARRRGKNGSPCLASNTDVGAVTEFGSRSRGCILGFDAPQRSLAVVCK